MDGLARDGDGDERWWRDPDRMTGWRVNRRDLSRFCHPRLNEESRRYPCTSWYTGMIRRTLFRDRTEEPC